MVIYRRILFVNLISLMFATIFTVTLFCYNPIPVNAGSSFKFYESLLFNGKPDFANLGISPLIILYEDKFWDEGDDRDIINEEKVASVAKSLEDNTLVCIDIECWDYSSGNLGVIVDKFRKIAEIIKKYKPSVKLGFYGFPPIRNYWSAIADSDSVRYQAWTARNDQLLSMSDFVDVIFPSLYTFHSSQLGWKKYAIANIAEAKKYGKPVYPFLWPHYHPSSESPDSEIPSEYWQLQLEVCKEYADGIVFWGGWDIVNKAKRDWNPDLQWWKVTAEFVLSATEESNDSLIEEGLEDKTIIQNNTVQPPADLRVTD